MGCFSDRDHSDTTVLCELVGSFHPVFSKWGVDEDSAFGEWIQVILVRDCLRFYLLLYAQHVGIMPSRVRTAAGVGANQLQIFKHECVLLCGKPITLEFNLCLQHITSLVHKITKYHLCSVWLSNIPEIRLKILFLKRWNGGMCDFTFTCMPYT